MTAGRNDLCPCGSGKKYKKCCMKKDNVIQLQQVKEERYFQKKNHLVDKIHQFLFEKISLKERTILENELAKRLERQIAPEYLSGIFPFWLTFFYRFENGLRGIEWFIQDVKRILVTEEELHIATGWSKLVPKLIRTINKEQEGILVEDVRTKEQFFMGNNDLMPDAPPWAGSFCILEEYEGDYLYHGIMFWCSPEQVINAQEMITRIIKEENKTYEQVVFEYYPEILSSLLHHHISHGEEILNKLDETTLLYEIHNKNAVMEYFVDHPEYVFDEWKDGDGKLSLTGNWHCYEDEYMPGPMYLGEVYGIIQIKNNKLLYNSLFSNKVAEFKNEFNLLGNACELIGEESETLEVPINAEVRNICIRASHKITPNLGIIAQQSWFLSELDKPIPKYDNLSIHGMLNVGRVSEVDFWLREQEYNSYLQLREQFNEVTMTADYNSIRRELGLPLSPFSIDRKTSFASCSSPIQRQKRLSEADIKVLQELGFTQEMASDFYTQDILRFYQERTNEKSNSTIQKYRNSLIVISEYLAQTKNTSWQEFTNMDWEKLIHYFEENYSTSMTQIKNFTSTLKSFAQWLDSQYNLNSRKTVLELCSNYETKKVK